MLASKTSSKIVPPVACLSMGGGRFSFLFNDEVIRTNMIDIIHNYRI